MFPSGNVCIQPEKRFSGVIFKYHRLLKLPASLFKEANEQTPSLPVRRPYRVVEERDTLSS